MNPYLIQISKKFKSIKLLPPWLRSFLLVNDQIRILRTALGMTQSQLAKRIGLKNNNPVAEIENKTNVNPSIETLKKYAKAFECELIIRFVPKKEIKDLIEELAEKKAREIVSLSVANSAMELQKPDKETIESEVERIKRELVEKRRSILWEK